MIYITEYNKGESHVKLHKHYRGFEADHNILGDLTLTWKFLIDNSMANI